jgi:hypothetical protein
MGAAIDFKGKPERKYGLELLPYTMKKPEEWSSTRRAYLRVGKSVFVVCITQTQTSKVFSTIMSNLQCFSRSTAA